MIIFSNFTEVLASLQLRLAQNHLTCSHQLLLLLTDDLHCLLKDFSSSVPRALCELMVMLSSTKTRNRALTSARHKVKFLQACVGKGDQASEKWCGKYVSPLLDAVESSICQQTMRIETEKTQSDSTAPEKPKTAGPNWRSIIRDIQKHKPTLIEEVNLPHLQP